MSEDEKHADAVEQADAEENVEEVEVPALSARLKRSLAAPVEPETATS
ncbi:MAG: hypothetical protein JWP87_4515, partial [Labilithrix sp.]|nr:hypothetical protein [Labilithrix sp.]